MTRFLKSAATVSIIGMAVGVISGASASAATLFPTVSGAKLQLVPPVDAAQTFSTANANGGGYYYTFTTDQKYKLLFTDSGNLQATPIINPFVIETGATPGGTVLGSSIAGAFSSGLIITLDPGTYNLYVASTTTREALAGTASVAAALGVTEPGAWSLIILGIGGVGGSLRSRRFAPVAAG